MYKYNFLKKVTKCYITSSKFKNPIELYIGFSVDMYSTIPDNFQTVITWDNIADIAEKHKNYFYQSIDDDALWYRKSKNGKNEYISYRKEGKTHWWLSKQKLPDLKIVVDIQYINDNKYRNINDVLNYRDIPLAINYLTERGLTSIKDVK